MESRESGRLQMVTAASGRVYQWDSRVSVGEGAYGSVHPARLVSSGADNGSVEGPTEDSAWGDLVVKVVLVNETRGTAKWLESARLTQREIEVNRALRAHGVKNVLPVVDDKLGDGAWLFVMPRAEYSLRDHLVKTGPMAEEATKSLLVSVGQILVDLAAVPVIHRDIKPGNVLWHDGQWKLADFGTSAIESTPSPSVSWVGTGTHDYWAPELFIGGRETVSTDLYALGCTALECLTGTPPFNGAPDVAIAHRSASPPIPALRDPVLERLLQDLLSKEPALRPPDARTIVERLSSTRELSTAQHKLQHIASDVSRRENERQSQQQQGVLKGERGEIAVATWRRVIEAYVAQIRDAIGDEPEPFERGEEWVVAAADARLSTSLHEGHRPEVLRTGWVAVKHLDVPSRDGSLVAHLYSLWENDRPLWRLVQFKRRDASSDNLSSASPVSGGGAVTSRAHFEEYLDRHVDGVPDAGSDWVVRDVEATADELLAVFTDEVLAITAFTR